MHRVAVTYLVAKKIAKRDWKWRKNVNMRLNFSSRWVKIDRTRTLMKIR